MIELLLGIDIGTSNVKAVLATPDGQVRAQAAAALPIHHLRPGWVEQDPADWWQGVVAVTRAVLKDAHADPAQVAGIGVSGQGCAVTLIDQTGDVIRPAIIGMDSRSEAQCAQLRSCCAATILDRNGKQPAPYNADPVLLWLQQHEPQSIDMAQTSLTTTGYITYKLTDEQVLNVSDASILFAFDLHTGHWSDDLIDAFGLPRRLYPRVAPCSEVVGGLTAAAAELLSLRSGIPVVAGGEDTSSAGLAMGVVRPGQALLSLGTAGTIYVVPDDLIVHPDLLTFAHVLPDQLLFGGSMVAAGAALHWCRDLIGSSFSFDELTALAAEASPGSDGVIFLPYLSGELQPINDGNARGVFFGLSMSTTRAQIVRAVLEGTAYAIAHNLQVAHEAGARIEEIRAVGGPTRSALWCQIIADVTGRVVAVMDDAAGAPLGDALLAAVGAGLIADAGSVASRAARIERSYAPRETEHAHYQQMFALYQQLYPALKTQFAAHAALSQWIR
jgi:xylulokinase